MSKSLKNKQIQRGREAAKKGSAWSAQRAKTLRTYRPATQASYCGNCK